MINIKKILLNTKEISYIEIIIDNSTNQRKWIINNIDNPFNNQLENLSRIHNLYYRYLYIMLEEIQLHNHINPFLSIHR